MKNIVLDVLLLEQYNITKDNYNDYHLLIVGKGNLINNLGVHNQYTLE